MGLYLSHSGDFRIFEQGQNVCVSRGQTPEHAHLIAKGTLLYPKDQKTWGKGLVGERQKGIQVSLLDICVPGIVSGNSYMSCFILPRAYSFIHLIFQQTFTKQKTMLEHGYNLSTWETKAG